MDVPPISPLLFYRNPKAALDFLERAFGFETRLVVDTIKLRLTLPTRQSPRRRRKR